MLDTEQSLALQTIDKDVQVDGVTYLLTARRLANGWFGSWSCCGCGKQGVDGVLYTTAKSALDVTTKNLGRHRCPAKAA